MCSERKCAHPCWSACTSRPSVIAAGILAFGNTFPPRSKFCDDHEKAYTWCCWAQSQHWHTQRHTVLHSYAKIHQWEQIICRGLSGRWSDLISPGWASVSAFRCFLRKQSLNSKKATISRERTFKLTIESLPYLPLSKLRLCKGCESWLELFKLLRGEGWWDRYIQRAFFKLQQDHNCWTIGLEGWKLYAH